MSFIEFDPEGPRDGCQILLTDLPAGLSAADTPRPSQHDNRLFTSTAPDPRAAQQPSPTTKSSTWLLLYAGQSFHEGCEKAALTNSLTAHPVHAPQADRHRRMPPLTSLPHLRCTWKSTTRSMARLTIETMQVCNSAIGSAEFYDHAKTEQWNSTIIVSNRAHHHHNLIHERDAPS